MYPSMLLRDRSANLLHPELREYLARYLRRRLPRMDADDALQAVYCAALEANNIPNDREHLRRWLTVIARRQVAAYYERQSTEQLGDPIDVTEEEQRVNAVEIRSLWRWAEQQAACSQIEAVDQTLDWMARESDGEKLETIAADTHIPSARIRQRVFRLRRFMKERWALEISAALLLVAMASWILSRDSEPIATPHPVPMPIVSNVVPIASANNPAPRAAEVRKMAFKHCDENQFTECLRMLDEAAALDPLGDTDSQVIAARKQAADKLASPPPLPSAKVPAPTPPPRSTSTPPGPRSTSTPLGPRKTSSGTTPASTGSSLGSTP